MQTLIEAPSLEQSIALCCELGLDFIEINMNLPEYQLDVMEADKTVKALAATGRYLTIHLDDNLNVCDFNLAVADAYFDTVMQTIEFAKRIKAPIINMHMSDGVYFKLPERVYLFERYMEKYLDRLRYFRDACEKALTSCSTIICIENCGEYHGFQRQGIELLLESRCFGLTYDIGHDFCAGNANESFIRSKADRVKHMHVHDALGLDNHLPLGRGEIAIKDKLAFAEEQGCRCVLETKTIAGIKESLAWIGREWANKHEPQQSATSEEPSVPMVTNGSTNDEKIELFLSLFCGRNDVYAKRWENKNSLKSGYSQACYNDWVAGGCEKPKVKCGECKNSRFVPFDKMAIMRHLQGKEVAGIYPMLPDETCLLLAIDFDKDGWQEDVHSASRPVGVFERHSAHNRQRSRRARRPFVQKRGTGQPIRFGRLGWRRRCQ
jgi:sugar phosphate isomerase/epimerase